MNVATRRKGGFTLIEVLIAVLVLAIALGASLNALGNYVRFQTRLSGSYTAHGVAWNALMRCYVASVQKGGDDQGEVSCELSGIGEQGGVDWPWAIETDEIEDQMLFYEITVSSASRDEVLSRLQALMNQPL